MIALATANSRGDDWPQWLGPQRDSVWRETGIVDKFPDGGPKVRWRTPIAGGYAGPAVAGGRVYVTDRILKPRAEDPADPFTRGQTPATERVLCLNEADGKVLWKHQYDCLYDGSMMLRLDRDRPAASVVWQRKGRSERNTDALHSIICTPFLEEGFIYGVCSYGQLRGLKADTGDRLWETLAATTGKLDRWATAFIVKNGSRFFLFNEQGDLIIARLTPTGYEEISRAHLVEPTNTAQGRNVVWSHPAFANRSVYARNDKEIVCASLAAPPTTTK